MSEQKENEFSFLSEEPEEHEVRHPARGARKREWPLGHSFF